MSPPPVIGSPHSPHNSFSVSRNPPAIFLEADYLRRRVMTFCALSNMARSTIAGMPFSSRISPHSYTPARLRWRTLKKSDVQVEASAPTPQKKSEDKKPHALRSCRHIQSDVVYRGSTCHELARPYRPERADHRVVRRLDRGARPACRLPDKR